MNQPLVSIIMPVHNGERHLREAIQSVIMQDYENWELLIVDDGSEDNSARIAREITDTRITIFTGPKGGVASARNRALGVMQGDFFCFLDADDVLTPHSLAVRLRCFNRNDVCFADGAVEIFNSDMDEKLGFWVPRATRYHLKSLVRLDGKCFFGPTWMIRKTPGINYRFDEDLTHGEELFFYMSYAHLGAYAATERVVLKYRKSGSSAMNNLKGLGIGYSLIKSKMKALSHDISLVDHLIFNLRSRKIMCLSFWKAREIRLALNYLIFGSV